MRMTFTQKRFVLVEPEKKHTHMLSDGWNWSRASSCYYTSDPYAALEYEAVADGVAKPLLAELKAAYDASWSVVAPAAPIPCPAGLTPFPYQLGGAAGVIGRSRILIGDPPGTGKTLQPILAANAMQPKRVLVICPGGLRLNWEREIKRWSTTKNVIVWTVLEGGHGIHPAAHWNVMSYGLVGKLREEILKLKWDMLVLDECHYLKNYEAARTKAILGAYSEKETFLDHFPKIVALTGTPLLNRPREAYTLARALCWDAIDWQSEDTFKAKYNPSSAWGEAVGREPELQARLRCNFMLRRERNLGLGKHYGIHYLETNGKIKAALVAESLLKLSDTQLDEGKFKLDGHVAEVRRQMGEAKVQRVIEHIKTLQDGGVDKLVVFCYHTSVIEAVAAAFGDSTVVVDGKVSMKERQRRVDAFQSDPAVTLFVGQLTAAGVGITLTAANYVLLAEPSWTPGENEQAVDRCYRVGQDRDVVAQYLLVPGSLDDRIISRVLSKTKTIHNVLDRKG